MLDREGYRPNVGIILCNAKNEVFWGCWLPLKHSFFAIHHTHLAGAPKALILLDFSKNRPFKLYCEATTHQGGTPHSTRGQL